MPIDAAKNIQNKVDPFAYYIDENMHKQVVKHTNERARKDLRNRGKNPDEWVPIDLCERKGIVGVLYLIDVYCCQHESLCLLWSPCSSGGAIFFASFDRYRFEQLIAYLRFDSREDRNTDDKPAPFRRMWKQFIENYR